jgi:hypothetical protein
VLQHYWSTTALSAAATLCHSSIKIVLVTFLCAAALLVDNSFVGSCNIVWQQHQNCVCNIPVLQHCWSTTALSAAATLCGSSSSVLTSLENRIATIG